MHCMGCGAEGDPMSNFIIDRGRMAHQHRPKEGGRGCGRAQGLQCASSIEHRAGSIGHPRLLRALPLLLLLPTALSPLPPSLFPPVPPSSRIWADVVGCGRKARDLTRPHRDGAPGPRRSLDDDIQTTSRSTFSQDLPRALKMGADEFSPPQSGNASF